MGFCGHRGDELTFYGVVSASIQQVIEFFLTAEDAMAMIASVQEDEPELAGLLEVVSIEFAVNPN
ncbi:MAG: hypothetical protein ACRDOG_15915 [Gaiellaceae bacterium]